MTFYGGMDMRHEVARITTPDLIKILQENASSPTISDLTMSILTHTVARVYMDSKCIFQQFDTIKIRLIIEAVLANQTGASALSWA